jgi:hypothetical protein
VGKVKKRGFEIGKKGVLGEKVGSWKGKEGGKVGRQLAVGG